MERIQRLSIVLLWLWLWLLIFPAWERASAQQPIPLRANPDIQQISLDTGPKEIKIHAETDMTSPSFFWNLDGPGKLIGEKGGWSISYIPPEDLEEESDVTAVISVTVREEGGRTQEGEMILTLQDPTPAELPIARAEPPADRDAALSEAVLRPEPQVTRQAAAAPEPVEADGAAPAPQPVEAADAAPAPEEETRTAALPEPEKEPASPALTHKKKRRNLPEKRATPTPKPEEGPADRLGRFKELGDRALAGDRYTDAEKHYRNYLSLYSGIHAAQVTPRLDVESLEVQDRLVAAIDQRLTQQLSFLKDQLSSDLEDYRKLREQENQGTYIAEKMLPLLKRIIGEIEEIESIYTAFPKQDTVIVENLSRARSTRKTFEEELSVRRARRE